MLFYYNGELEILDGKSADETVQRVFRDHELIGRNSIGAATRFHGSTVDINDLEMGSILEDLIAAAKELSDAGYHMECTITYYGDCDGGIEVFPDGTVCDYNNEEWALRNVSDEFLLNELSRRGYNVQPMCRRHKN